MAGKNKNYDVNQTNTDKRRNRLIILSESASFPWGMAATNRVRNLAKAVQTDGWSVKYISLRGADITKKQGKKYKTSGKSDGIMYFYPGLFALRSKNWWARRIDDLLGLILTIYYMLLKKFLCKIDVVLFYSRNNKIMSFWIFFLHLLRIPIILEMCEWPLAIAEVKKSGHMEAEQFCLNIVPKVDAVLTISTYINTEIAKIAEQKQLVIPSFQIPILIDVEDDISETLVIPNSRVILYCGSISYMDIAMIVVDIVQELKNRNIDFSVKITGEINAASLAEFKKHAVQKGVFNRFEFTGLLEEGELYNLMRQATCLLAPLPKNLQSKSRFPTKIGYYLASATPVVTNSIGDIGLHLRDGVNAFVAAECDVSKFAEKIETIFNEPDLSLRVGIAGRALALEKFHFTTACKGLGDFMRKVAEDYK